MRIRSAIVSFAFITCLCGQTVEHPWNIGIFIAAPMGGMSNDSINGTNRHDGSTYSIGWTTGLSEISSFKLSAEWGLFRGNNKTDNANIKNRNEYDFVQFGGTYCRTTSIDGLHILAGVTIGSWTKYETRLGTQEITQKLTPGVLAGLSYSINKRVSVEATWHHVFLRSGSSSGFGISAGSWVQSGIVFKWG